jgi:hypothetical protein
VHGSDWQSWKLVFPTFGAHYISGYLGTFKCLLLAPDMDRDSRALEIFRFVAANTLHSDVDRATISPWPKRSRYVRPDLLLGKLFLSDQPLGLQCSHTADMLAYLLYLAGYEARRVDVVDPDVGVGGHTVLEAFLPGQGSWVMLDADFGVVVKDGNGRLLSVADLIDNRRRLDALDVTRAVAKQWLPANKHTAIAYRGQLSWAPGMQLGGPTVLGGSYHEVISRCFRKLDTTVYRFQDDFSDNAIMIEG